MDDLANNEGFGDSAESFTIPIATEPIHINIPVNKSFDLEPPENEIIKLVRWAS